jgi:hypothetical protein
MSRSNPIPFSADFSAEFDALSPAPPPDTNGWPTINDLATFAGQSATDEVLVISLAAAIAYGQGVLSSVRNGQTWDYGVRPDVFQACLDYAASLYTARIQGDSFTVDAVQGATPMQRYRKVLLNIRPPGFA